MNRFLAPLAIATAILMVPLSSAEASGERHWNVCGGTPYSGYTGFALCASVTATVETNNLGEHVLTMKVYNLSGLNGSYSGTVFTSIGLENVIPSSINVVAGSLEIKGPCVGSSDPCDYSDYWQVVDNKSIGGGVQVDLLTGSFNSKYSIASQCGIDDEATPGHNLYFATSCFDNGPDFVTLSFRVTDAFDPEKTGDLFIKGQNGYPNGGGSTTCLSTNANCIPQTTVPEPITTTLVATGMGIWGGIGYIRRRRQGANTEA
jgi:hypothetical protein